MLRPWFHFWRHVVAQSPHGFAYATAVVERLVAAGLVLGFGRRVLPAATHAWTLDRVVEQRFRRWRALAEPGGRRGLHPPPDEGQRAGNP